MKNNRIKKISQEATAIGLITLYTSTMLLNETYQQIKHGKAHIFGRVHERINDDSETSFPYYLIE